MLQKIAALEAEVNRDCSNEKENMTVSTVDFGGVGDGRTLNGWLFRMAIYKIRHLRRRGGTMLHVPAGVWLTGNFNLTSQLTLYLARGAVVKATKFDRFSLCFFQSLL